MFPPMSHRLATSLAAVLFSSVVLLMALEECQESHAQMQDYRVDPPPSLALSSTCFATTLKRPLNRGSFGDGIVAECLKRSISEQAVNLV